MLLATAACVLGATIYEGSMSSLLDCRATARAGYLPCDALWPLGNTTSNADPARMDVRCEHG